MPTVLLQPEEEFEEKYPKSGEDDLSEDQLEKVNMVFKKILFEEWTEYYGQADTYSSLMQMHKTRFKIMENLNDLLCQGRKDYKDSLATVQDFNCTKIMTRKCSVPQLNRDVTMSRIYYGMLKAIELDIQVFNHIFDIFNGGEGLHIDFIENGGNGSGSVSESKMNLKFKKRRNGGMQGGSEKEPMMQIDEDEDNMVD
mmetsp:Transcript_34665/g.53077  ORF Transcript_34665/g.53077 Transcript_34665/m.53077 type:complete len:198 (+) Transcript_34665:3833-4426(+)